MSILSKGLAVVCALASIVTGVASMLLFNLDQKAFDPQTYQQVFAEEELYQRLPSIIAKALVASPQQDDLPLAMQGLSTENWENFIRALLPPEALQAMGEDALEALFAYINGEKDVAEFSLVPLKQSMAGEAGIQAVLDLMNTQPDCSVAQIARMSVAILSEDEIVLCNPPQEALPLITPIIKGQLQFAAAVIPDRIPIISADAGARTEDPRRQLRVLRVFMRLSPLVPLGFLLALSLLVVRSLRSWLVWWGWPMFFTGLMAILSSLLGAPVVGLLILRFMLRHETNYIPAVFLDSGSQLAAAIVEQLLRPTLLQGLTLATLGIILVMVAFFMKRFAAAGQVLPSGEGDTLT